MGYYIQGPNIGKAGMLVTQHGGQIVDSPPQYQDIPAGKAVICVVGNSLFDAAAFAYSEQELADFQLPNDVRPKTWVIMDRELAVTLTGYMEV